MHTRKRKGKRRKTKRGGDMYMMAGIIATLNGLMMTVGPLVGSHVKQCEVPVAIEPVTPLNIS